MKKQAIENMGSVNYMEIYDRIRSNQTEVPSKKMRHFLFEQQMVVIY